MAKIISALAKIISALADRQKALAEQNNLSHKEIILAISHKRSYKESFSSWLMAFFITSLPCPFSC